MWYDQLMNANCIKTIFFHLLFVAGWIRLISDLKVWKTCCCKMTTRMSDTEVGFKSLIAEAMPSSMASQALTESIPAAPDGIERQWLGIHMGMSLMIPFTLLLWLLITFLLYFESVLWPKVICWLIVVGHNFFLLWIVLQKLVNGKSEINNFIGGCYYIVQKTVHQFFMYYVTFRCSPAFFLELRHKQSWCWQNT